MFHDLFERKGFVDDGEFDWTGKTMSTPIGSLQTAHEVISPQRHHPHAATHNNPRAAKVVTSTNGELNADDPTAGHSNTPITAQTELETQSETKCCCFKRKKKKSASRPK